LRPIEKKKTGENLRKLLKAEENSFENYTIGKVLKNGNFQSGAFPIAILHWLLNTQALFENACLIYCLLWAVK
jgi:hypothetical protein